MREAAKHLRWMTQLLVALRLAGEQQVHTSQYILGQALLQLHDTNQLPPDWDLTILRQSLGYRLVLDLPGMVSMATQGELLWPRAFNNEPDRILFSRRAARGICLREGWSTDRLRQLGINLKLSLQQQEAAWVAEPAPTNGE